MTETRKRKADSIEDDVAAAGNAKVSSWDADSVSCTAVIAALLALVVRSRLTITQGKKLWRTPRQDKRNETSQTLSIEPGDAGIWATCDMGKESRCVGELKNLFEEVRWIFLSILSDLPR